MSLTSGREQSPAQDYVPLDSSLWSSFLNAKNDTAFLTGWLALLVNRVAPAALGAVLQADQTAGAFVPVAVVPDPRRDLGYLREAAEQAIQTGRPATLPGDDGRTILAYPVRIDEAHPDTLVVLELRAAGPDAVQAAIRDVHWASGWLVSRQWQSRAGEQGAQVDRAAVALDLLALASEHRRPEAAAMAIVNELQTVLACDQISIGMIVGRHRSPRIRLLAMSYSAWFKKRSRVAETLETAMEEAFDQNATVAHPPLPGTERAIAVAHGDHVRAGRTMHILSVPLDDEVGPVGAISVERRSDRPFTDAERRMAESVAALIGPLLELKRRTRRWIGGRIWDTVVHALGVVLGPRRLSWKVLALALIGLGVAAATVDGRFRVQADAVLRGAVQRAAVAPFAGFVDAAPVRAGDRVAAGDLLARLDDTDLRLEALRWRSEIDRLAAQQRDAVARYERPEVAFLEAQIAQARAQLDLTEAELARTRITSPIDGLVVSGDLTQKLGAPVQAGEVLFEVAPLESYRVDAYLDERDLRWVAEGQQGRLALAGRPEAGLDLVVTRITPVAEPREGRNTFRVEADLVADPAGLRPGMEGVAKIDAGEALLAWIWTRRLVDWVRETAWTWQP